MLFAVKLFDRDDPGGALRDANRDEHLAYLDSFEDRTLFAGPILTEDRTKELGSHRLIDLKDRAEAEPHGERALCFGRAAIRRRNSPLVGQRSL